MTVSVLTKDTPFAYPAPLVSVEYPSETKIGADEFGVNAVKVVAPDTA